MSVLSRFRALKRVGFAWFCALKMVVIYCMGWYVLVYQGDQPFEKKVLADYFFQFQRARTKDFLASRAGADKGFSSTLSARGDKYFLIFFFTVFIPTTMVYSITKVIAGMTHHPEVMY